MSSINRKTKPVFYKAALLAGVVLLLLAVVANASGVDQNTVDSKDGILRTEGGYLNLDTDLGGTGLFYKMLLALIIVAGLGFVAWYLSRKFLPGFVNPQTRQIKIVETVGLGPKKTLQIISVGSKVLLIGSTPESINTLADISDEYEVAHGGFEEE